MGRIRVLSSLVLATLLVACAQPGPSGSPSQTSTHATSRSTSTSTPSSPAPQRTTRTTPAQPSASTPTPTPTRSATVPATTPRVGKDAWITVSVATLWRSPSSPRAIDSPALSSPANIRTWLSGLTDSERRGLSGRADTQALLGDRVVVTARSGAWAKVVVPNQPTPKDGRGYPGWLPLRQLTARQPSNSARDATVVSRTTWLRSDDVAKAPVVEVSFGTRLPRVGVDGDWVRVETPTGRVLRVSTKDVSVTPSGAPALPASGREIVRTATMFTGLPYLWAGTSGFGFDCSGLTSLDYRVHGIIIARDAGPQSKDGSRVSPSTASPGDLLFYATDGVVHHVSIYAGNGQMVHAPRTGATVETIPVATRAYAVELSGARRYLD